MICLQVHEKGLPLPAKAICDVIPQSLNSFDISRSMGSLALSHLPYPSTISIIQQIYLHDTCMLIYICTNCITHSIDSELGFLPFQFSWDDEGIAMWVGGTCGSGSEELKVKVAITVSKVSSWSSWIVVQCLWTSIHPCIPFHEIQSVQPTPAVDGSYSRYFC